MDLLSVATLKTLCSRAGIRPSRSAGQNFLVNRKTLDAIVSAVDPQPHDTVLEVGAGFGVLTTALASRVARVIAVERDSRIIPILRDGVSADGNVNVVEGNILELLEKGTSASMMTGVATDRTLRGAGWKLAANLPYSITSDFLRILFDRVADGFLPPPERAVLLLQREVVDRLVAVSGSKRDRRSTSVLTILTQLHCAPRRVQRIPATHFWPVPRVESAVVALSEWRTPREMTTFLGGGSRERFLSIVRVAFASRRRQLRNGLQAFDRRWNRGDVAAALQHAGIAPTARPEELTVAQWVALARSIRGGASGRTPSNVGK